MHQNTLERLLAVARQFPGRRAFIAEGGLQRGTGGNLGTRMGSATLILGREDA